MNAGPGLLPSLWYSGMWPRSHCGFCARVAVVLEDVDHRQVVDRREVHRLVERALVQRPVAEVAQRDVVLLLVLDRKAQPHAQGALAADDRVPAVHVVRLVEQVHRPALALRAAGHLAEHLGHRVVRLHPLGQRQPVVAIGPDDDVVIAIAVEVARSGDAVSEVVVGCIAIPRVDRQTCLPRENGRTAAVRALVVIRVGADAQIGEPVAVDIAGTRDGKQGDHVLLAPPFILADDQIGELTDKLATAFDSVL